MNVTLIDPFIWISVIRTKITRKIKINRRHDFYLFPPKNEILLYNHKWNLGNSISGTFLFSLSLAVRNNNFFLEEIKRAWNHRSNRNLLFASRSPQVSTMRVKKYCFAESFLAEDASPLRGKKNRSLMVARHVTRSRGGSNKSDRIWPDCYFLAARSRSKNQRSDRSMPLLSLISNPFSRVFKCYSCLTRLFWSMIFNRYSCSFKHCSYYLVFFSFLFWILKRR